MKKICLTSSFSAVAASNFEGGQTVHSLFGLPAEPEKGDLIACNPGSINRTLIQYATIIVVDELPCLHRMYFEAIIEHLEAIKSNCILICAGDFRQIPPVVKGASTQGVVESSPCKSPKWPDVEVFLLKEPLRSRLDPHYAEFALALGSNDPSVCLSMQEGNPIVDLSIISQRFEKETTHQAVQFVFSHAYTNAQCAILCATNERVDFWNSIIQEKLPGTTVSLIGVSTVSADSECAGFSSSLTDDFLNSLQLQGVPPNELKLKIGDICIITRNIDKAEGLYNNTRVQIVGIRLYKIRVQVLQSKKMYVIPRIRFNSILGSSGLQVTRVQFPLRLAYAVTFNKSQSLTMDKVLLDITHPPFMHGHLYVALMRVRHRNDIALFHENGVKNTTILNCVFSELLESPHN